MGTSKRPAKRKRGRDKEELGVPIKLSKPVKEKASTLEEAIQLKHKKFKNKTILYLDTVFEFGMHRGDTVRNVLKTDRSYIAFCIRKLNIFISDEVTLAYNFQNQNQ